MKTIHERAFNELKENGHCVPRLWDTADNITQFTVGKEYFVTTAHSTEKLKVRCTQDCPIHIKVIQ